MIDVLRNFEDRTVVPWVEQLGAEPIRDDAPVTMIPGGVAFLVNNATSYEVVDDVVRWTALTVTHEDTTGQNGVVLQVTAAMAGTTGWLDSATITDVMTLERDGDGTVWRDPISDQVFRRYERPIVDHAWWLFRGVMLPMLASKQYRFPKPIERRAFQVNVIRVMNACYEGT